MHIRITDPSQALPGWFEDRAAKFEAAYPDFYKIPDIVKALNEAQKVGVHRDVLKGEIGFDLQDRKRMIEYRESRTPPTEETQKKARKSLKTVESVIKEIAGLRYQFEESIQRAISDLKDFPVDHIATDEYQGAFSCFLSDTPSNPDVPPMNGQKILGALSIEKATSASLSLLDKIREALIVTMEPKEPPMMAILKRDAKGLRKFPKERRGVKPDHFVQGTKRKYAEFFRETTGSPQDGIARLIVGHLVAPLCPEEIRKKWLDDDREDGVTPTESYKWAREAAERAPNPWPFKEGALAMLGEYHRNNSTSKRKRFPS